MYLPRIGAYDTWNVVGGQVTGRMVQHLGGNRFLVETRNGRVEVEIDQTRPPVHPNDFQRRPHSEY